MFILSLAFAHIGIESPPPRYPSDGFSDNKHCPCGVGTGGTTCTGDRSDPDRGTDVTVYAPGETITVSWHEVIGHTGRYRIAFDDDGADLDDFNANILLDIEDPPGNAGNTGIGDLWEVQVTLPSTPCDTCTLQLIQVMNGNTVDPVPDPTGMSTYYQCADIELALPDTGETGLGATADTGVSGPTADTGVVVGPTADTGVVVGPTADTGDSGPLGGSNADTGRGDTGRTHTGDSAPPTGHTGAADTGHTGGSSTSTPGTTPRTTPGTTPGTTAGTSDPTHGATPGDDIDEGKGCGCQVAGQVGGPWLLRIGWAMRRR
jgi:hypothetical protein